MTNERNSIRVGLDTERTVTAPFTGAFQTVGAVLSENPVIIIFDNESTVAVEVSVNGTSSWKTFSAGTAVVLDLRANHGQPYNYSFPIGTQFYVRGTAGTGLFSIAITYAE